MNLVGPRKRGQSDLVQGNEGGGRLPQIEETAVIGPLGGEGASALSLA
jgi:hypothetical protein